MRLYLIVFLILLPISAGFCMQKQSIHQYELDNGLKIIVQEDHRAPVVVSQVWYKVGAVDETRGKTGLSHALEHMMFLGTDKVPKDEFSKIIGDLGGYENAFTSEDQTVYYEEIGKQHLETCLRLEADRMSNLEFDQKEIMRELEVIKEERRLRVDDNPHGITWERFLATAYASGGYQNPVIGWMPDIDAITVADLKDWYQTWYAPNHATVVIVGDVDPTKTFKLCETYFGDIKKGKPAPAIPKEDVGSIGQRMIKVHTKASVPYVLQGFEVPSIGSHLSDLSDVYALMVLQAVLDGGYSSRFEKNIVRKSEIAASIGVYYDPYQRYQTQFTISATPSEQHDIASLQKAIEAEIMSLQENPIEEQELARAKMHFTADYVYEKDSMSQQAMQLGALALIGYDVSKTADILQQIKAVTAQDVQRVAKQYLVSKRQTIAEMIPTSADEGDA